ncbi:LamB/YcsF family protein [Microbacterium sp. NPDC055683]
MIDLNSDLGENEPDRVVSDDAAMLDVVTSANVSCGRHAGTTEGIRATLAAAVAAGVTIGAHPGYPDRAGFGRRRVEGAPAALRAEVEEQVGALAALARAAGGRIAYVKPHGALYHDVARDEERAAALVDAVRAVDDRLAVLALPGSAVLRLAERGGLRAVAEAFADRAYLPDGGLVPRSRTDAVLHDPGAVAARMARLVSEGVVEAVDGTSVRVSAESICVHGDSPGAVGMARAVRARLEADGIPLASFAGAT